MQLNFRSKCAMEKMIKNKADQSPEQDLANGNHVKT